MLVVLLHGKNEENSDKFLMVFGCTHYAAAVSFIRYVHILKGVSFGNLCQILSVSNKLHIKKLPSTCDVMLQEVSREREMIQSLELKYQISSVFYLFTKITYLPVGSLHDYVHICIGIFCHLYMQYMSIYVRTQVRSFISFFLFNFFFSFFSASTHVCVCACMLKPVSHPARHHHHHHHCCALAHSFDKIELSLMSRFPSTWKNCFIPTGIFR